MSAMVDLEMAGERLERSRVELVVTAFFRDELPLRGGVGRADWRMCGLISDQILAGRMAGDWGEALLVPTSGRMRAARVMVLGLGKRGNYRLPEVHDAVRDAVERAIALGVSSLAMSPLGLAGEDFSRCAEAMVRGIEEGFASCERSLRIRFVLPDSELARSARALEEAIGPRGAANLRFSNKNSHAPQASSTQNRDAALPPSPR
jgi:hypothetical protein